MMPDDVNIEAVGRGLSDAQKQYVMFGPHSHWTQTRWALERRGIVIDPLRSPGKIGSFTSLGLAVRKYLLAKEGEGR